MAFWRQLAETRHGENIKAAYARRLRTAARRRGERACAHRVRGAAPQHLSRAGRPRRSPLLHTSALPHLPICASHYRTLPLCAHIASLPSAAWHSCLACLNGGTCTACHLSACLPSQLPPPVPSLCLACICSCFFCTEGNWHSSIFGPYLPSRCLLPGVPGHGGATTLTACSGGYGMPASVGNERHIALWQTTIPGS